MLKKLREELWEAKYLNPVWPSDLLENSRDPNYKSINFKPTETGLEVTLLFKDNGELISAVYIFNNEDYLQKLYMIEPTGKSLIYDRELEIQRIMINIHSFKKNSMLSAEIA